MDISFGPSLYVKQEPKCPVCARRLDGVTAVDAEAAQPNPGDLAVCIYCATLLRFEEGLTMRVLTQEDRDEVQREQPKTMALLDKMVTAAQQRIRQERRTRKRWH